MSLRGHASQAAVALAVAAAAAAVTGCGDGRAEGRAVAVDTRAVSGNPVLGPARLVNCGDWRRGDRRARLGTIHQLQAFVGGPGGSPAGRGPVLPDAPSYRLLAYWCGEDYATDYKLYKLYTRAAAFAPQ